MASSDQARLNQEEHCVGPTSNSLQHMYIVNKNETCFLKAKETMLTILGNELEFASWLIIRGLREGSAFEA